MKGKESENFHDICNFLPQRLFWYDQSPSCPPLPRAAPDEQGEHEHEHMPARGPAAALRQKPVPQHRQ